MLGLSKKKKNNIFTVFILLFIDELIRGENWTHLNKYSTSVSIEPRTLHLSSTDRKVH